MFESLKERLQFAKFCIVHRRSRKTQEKWQGRRLRDMLRHANTHVPIWKELFTKHDVDIASIRDLADLPKLPITNKRMYLGRMAEEYTDSSTPALSYWYVTSGTSGVPFTFLMSPHARDTKYTDFASLRFLWWRGEPIRRIASINFARVKIRAHPSEHRFFLSVEDYLRDPRAALQKIAAFKPEIIGTYPSLLLDMAKLVERDPTLRNPELTYALSFGETLVPSIRKTVEAGLRCEIYDRYGLEEIGAVGVECREHNGFHINTESVIVEVLGDAGETLSPGEQGRLVVTDLFNFGMPFIRYDSGDSGKISYEICACGLRSPRVWVQGRYSAYLTFPQRRIHHLEFDAAMDTFMNYVYQYQIAKISDSEICARIVAGPSFNDEVPKKIEEHLRKLVGAQVRVAVEKVPALPVNPRGKSQIVIDESAVGRN